MGLPFVNLEHAQRYAEQIADPVERVWVQYCISRAVVVLGEQPSAQGETALNAVDLLLHARLAHASMEDRELVETILSGRYAQFRDIPDIF